MYVPYRERDPGPSAGSDGGDRDDNSRWAMAVVAAGIALLVVGAAVAGLSLFADPAGAEPSVQVGSVEATNATANVSEGGTLESLQIDLETNVAYRNVRENQDVRVELLLAIPGHNDGEPIQLDQEQVDVQGDGERTVQFAADALESEGIDAELFNPGDGGEYEDELTVIVRVAVVDGSRDDPVVDVAEASDTFTLTVVEEAAIVSFDAAAEVNAVGDLDTDDEEGSDGDEDSDDGDSGDG